ncbi:MAG: hypothetical protein U9M98_01945 [Patescibacteria group bacterium]|nr:hypothetical protein [Patescibacteria group bacterium]
MANITLSEKPNIVSVLEQVKEASASEVKLLLPKDTSYWNVLALKTLSRQAKAYGKELKFVAQNEQGKSLLAAFRGELPSARGVKAASPSILDQVLIFFQVARWKVLAIFGGLVLFVVAVVFVTLFYLSEAIVTVNFNTSPLVKTAAVSLDPQVSAPEIEGMVIPAISVDVQESGVYEVETTGEKEVGTKAEGTITAYNYDTSNSKSFSEDDELITEEEGLRFLLNESIEVEEASASAEGADRLISPGTTEVKVTAEKIGSSYNIAKGTNLYFESLDDDFWDDVYARAAEDFSGGESRTVSVATVQDQEQLLAEGLEQIKSKCSESLSGKLLEDQKLTGKAVVATPLEQSYTPAIGEEADNLSLSLKVRCSTLAYSGGDLNDVWQGRLAGLVPEGFELRDDDLEVSILTVERPPEAQGLVLQTEVETKLAPKVDEEKIREDLVGRSFSDLDAYFSTLPDINSYELQLKPPIIPGILGRFPLNKDRIHVIFGDNS